MMQGDQYRIPIELKDADGNFITQDAIKDLEVFVGKIRKTLSNGDLTFDSGENVFYIYLTQKETFMLSGDVEVQARVLFLSNDVAGINLGTINVEKSASRVVLK